MKNKKIKGLSITELIVVMSIIAILASAAIPLYSDYIRRSIISTVVEANSSDKSDISLFYLENNNSFGTSQTELDNTSFAQEGTLNTQLTNFSTTILFHKILNRA